MSLYLPPYEYVDAHVDRRTPRPPRDLEALLARRGRRGRLLRRWLR